MTVSGDNVGENILVTAPVNPAVDHDRLNEHLELTHSADNALIRNVGGYLPAATQTIENMACTSMITQTRRQILSKNDIVEPRNVRLSFGPVQSVSSVKYLDLDDAEQTLASTYYRVNAEQSTIYIKSGLPAIADGPGVLWVDYVAGFGDDSGDVPSEWQNVIMMLAFHLYDNRGGGIDHKFWRLLEYRVMAAGGSQRL